MRMLGVMPWSDLDSHVTVEDVQEAGKLLKRHRIKVSRVRFIGGEPSMHPDLKSIYDAVYREWEPRLVRTFTNGLVPVPEGIKSVRVWDRDKRKKKHREYYISPADVGVPMELNKGVCRRVQNCGRLFSAYGFAVCDMAPVVGRLLGVYAYHPHPVFDMPTDLCRHCIESVSWKTRGELRQAVRRGEIEYPTKTYREGIKSAKRHVFRPRRFLERLKEIQTGD